MMNEELAEYLISLEKYIVNNGDRVDHFIMDINYPLNFRLDIITPGDMDQNLLVDIKESEKKSLKLSLHHQDNDTKNGIVRIDYNGRHINPVDVLTTVPDKFIPYAGMWLDDFSGHIHYVVNGYKPLVWALPLEADDFPIKEINGSHYYSDILQAFFHRINLKTIVTINHQLRIV